MIQIQTFNFMIRIQKYAVCMYPTYCYKVQYVYTAIVIYTKIFVSIHSCPRQNILFWWKQKNAKRPTLLFGNLNIAQVFCFSPVNKNLMHPSCLASLLPQLFPSCSAICILPALHNAYLLSMHPSCIVSLLPCMAHYCSVSLLPWLPEVLFPSYPGSLKSCFPPTLAP